MNIFFYNGNEYVWYDRSEVLALIPNDLVRYCYIKGRCVHTEFSVKQHLKSTDFMEKDCTPTIDLRTEGCVITKAETIDRVEVEQQYVNMAKRLLFDQKAMVNHDNYGKELDLVCFHIRAM